MAACNLGNCTIHEILKCVSEILLVGNDDNTRDDDDDGGDGDDKEGWRDLGIIWGAARPSPLIASSR